MWLVITSHILV